MLFRSKAKAQSIRSRLLAGEPFARLVAEVSDSGSKANGGLVGPVNEDELVPALQSIVKAMKVDDISEPIRVPRGYQLLKLESRSEVTVRSFDDARNDIGDKIGQKKLDAERAKYLAKLRETATIVWRNEELKKAYETALAKASGPRAGN